MVDVAAREPDEDLHYIRAHSLPIDDALVVDMSHEEDRVLGAHTDHANSVLGMADESWWARILDGDHSPSRTSSAAPEAVVEGNAYGMPRCQCCYTHRSRTSSASAGLC